MPDTTKPAQLDSNAKLLQDLRNDYHALSNNFKEWKQSNHEDKKGIYERLSTLEEKAMYIPNAEEASLIREAAAFYKSKREFRERMYGALMEKGLTGLMVFVAAALFYYVKHLFTQG